MIVIDLRRKASYADYMIICSGTSDRQAKAITDNVEKVVHKELKKFPLGVEGKENGFWILMDFGDVVFHVFQEDSRSFYQLENLWHDARRVSLKPKKKVAAKKKTSKKNLKGKKKKRVA